MELVRKRNARGRRRLLAHGDGDTKEAGAEGETRRKPHFYEVEALIDKIDRQRPAEKSTISVVQAERILQLQRETAEAKEEIDALRRQVSELRKGQIRSAQVSKELMHCIEYFRSKVPARVARDEARIANGGIIKDGPNASAHQRLKELRNEIKRLRAIKTHGPVQSSVVHGYEQSFDRNGLIKDLRRMIKGVKKTVAATNVQRVFRGTRERQMLLKSKARQAAVMVQALWRGFDVRRKMWS